MNFNQQTIGLFLFYVAGAMFALALAILYWTSLRGRKRLSSSKN